MKRWRVYAGGGNQANLEGLMRQFLVGQDHADADAGPDPYAGADAGAGPCRLGVRYLLPT